MSKIDPDVLHQIGQIFEFEAGEIVANSLAASRERIGRSFAVLFGGYRLTAEDVLNETIRVENYAGFIVVKDINFYTYCEHHFAPFFGTAEIVYEPREIITGIGKLVRLVRDVHARRLQIQETMTKAIADDLIRVLDVKGVRVTTTAKHLCICSRGPSDDTAITEVQYGLGSLRVTKGG